MSFRVFLTGGTGYVGSAVLDALVRGGHQVTAIARDPEKVAGIESRGARGLLAELGTPARYMDIALESDVVVHAALEHSPRGAQLDGDLLDRLLPALSDTGSAKTFIYTSGIWLIGPAPDPADESVPVAPTPHAAWRAPLERRVLEATTLSLRTAVVRPGVVYGGKRGIVSDLLKNALNGLVRVIGPGTNHWPCVYDRDLGELYARIAETPEASGVYHVNDEGDEQVNDIVEAIADHVSPRPDIRHVPLEEARAKMGPYADALALDQRLRCPRARAIGWTPTLRSVSGNVARLLEEYRNAR
ncbi:MAG TPA: NAD-dependent epimerase/dehydratase family protein [Vicinamibacterales bacterium]|jgi:nucleoside-diphosphate-sugar epimerase|nr:NAD-dependent epimerase/dehydratase family protein [Vicinamibacterales bacterium]